jgi:hypothetical protein
MKIKVKKSSKLKKKIIKIKEKKSSKLKKKNNHYFLKKLIVTSPATITTIFANRVSYSMKILTSQSLNKVTKGFC